MTLKVERAPSDQSGRSSGRERVHPGRDRLRRESLATGHVPVVPLRPGGHQVLDSFLRFEELLDQFVLFESTRWVPSIF